MNLSIEDLARIKVEEAIQEGLKQSTNFRLLSNRNEQIFVADVRKPNQVDNRRMPATARLSLVFHQMIKSLGLL